MGIFSSDEFSYSDWREEYQKAMKYEKALKKIKKIILFNKVNRLSGGAYITIEQILQKINEVIDD